MASRNVATSSKRASARRPRRVVVAMSGGVDSSVVAALLAATGPRRHRRHPAALRSWRSRRAARHLLRRTGHPRRAPRRRPARHRPLRPRLRAALQGDRHAVLRGQLCGRRDADPVCGVQPADQVSRAACDRARARGGRARHRPLYRAAPRACRPRAVPRARRGARPELLSVRHHARAARLAELSPRRLHQGRGARAGARLRAAGGRQVRQPGHLLRARRAATPA